MIKKNTYIYNAIKKENDQISKEKSKRRRKEQIKYKEARKQ